MRNQKSNKLVTTLIFIIIIITPRDVSNAAKIHITDELDDVIDNEEDEEWKNWGKKKADPNSEFDVHPSELDKMEMDQIQALMMKRLPTGPVFGFVKLRFGVPRTPEVVSSTAMQWTKVSKTGGLVVKFTGMDLSTIMFSLEKGQDINEVKDFILEQPDAYEVKIGENSFRRPGDPPVEEVLEKLYRQKNNANGQQQHDKEEL